MPKSDLVRTQVQLTEEQHREAKRLAFEQGVSLSEVVRVALENYLSAQREDKS